MSKPIRVRSSRLKMTGTMGPKAELPSYVRKSLQRREVEATCGGVDIIREASAARLAPGGARFLLKRVVFDHSEFISAEDELHHNLNEILSGLDSFVFL